MLTTKWSLRINKLWIVLLMVGIIPFTTFSDSIEPKVFAQSSNGPVVLLDDDASSLNNAGWSRRIPPVDGVYIVDATHSLGNPNNTVTKPVEAGQYLFYGDHQASPTNTYSTIRQTLPIGPGAWSLEFSAKFVDLMKPSQNHIYRGISFEIFAAGKEYKITFNDSNKILAMTSLSPVSHEQREVVMPEDDDFHQWAIEYDGNYTVKVKLDGNVVANFTNIGIPVSGREDELVILNAPLNWQSGTNEVYMEHIRMVAEDREFIPSDMLFEDDGSSLQAVGWSGLTAPIDGLYIIDHPLSMGNPNLVELKEVPQGQYLLYGDEQASLQGKYNRLIKTLSIGSGAWTVEFSARFVDLMTPTSNHQDRGVYFDIIADNKRYKITFNDKDKIMVRANQRTQVHMPEDDEFHTWEIAYNGLDVVYVKLDGHIVATFENASVPVSGISDRLQIVNVPLNWALGTNEVYLDHIKMYKMDIGDAHVLIDDDAIDFAQAGWSADPPQTNAYFTDEGRSNGEVEGMMATDEGRYLTYAHSGATASTSISQQVEIGSDSWSVELDARMASLVVPTSTGADQGFMLEVIAGGLRHKLVFNDNNNVYISQADGSYLRVETTLLSNNYFDNWGIAYDEHGRLIVIQNGSKLGYWYNTGVPVQQPDGIVLTNHADGATGETTVYIDRIKLMRDMLPVWTEFQPLITGVTVLPDSDSTETSAIVSLYDTDPLWFDTGRLVLEANLEQNGQVVQHMQVPVSNENVSFTISSAGHTGWMDLNLKLRDGNQIKGSLTQKLDVYPTIINLQPEDVIYASPGEVLLYTDVDQVVDELGLRPWQAGWSLSNYQYEGSDRGGFILESTGASRPLQLPVRLNGWYGVYVGYVTGSEGFSVSDGHQHQDLIIEGIPSNDPYGNKAIGEVFALASNFQHSTITLSSLDDKQARIAYIKLKALTADEVALYQKPDEGEAGRRVIYNNDGYSDYFSGQYDNKQSLLNNAVNFFEDQDAHALYWTLGTTMLILRDSEVAGRPYGNLTPEQEQNLMRDGDKRVRDVIFSYIDADQDPAQIVAKRVNEIGMDAFISLRMSAFYSQGVYPWLNGTRYEEFVNKGYLQVKNTGTADIRMSYAYPEFQQYVIDVFKEAASIVDEDGQPLVKGVELDYCRYPYVLGYEPILTDAYLQQYGIDPRNETTAEGHERWNRFKAAVMTDFMQDVRQQLDGYDISVRIPHDLYEQNGLDIETWIQQQLIDTMVVCTLSHETFFDGIEYFHSLTEGTNVKLYGNINATLSGNDLTRQEEDLMKRGIRLNRGGERVSKQQFMLRALEFYEAGYDGVYIFNNWKGRTQDGTTILGALGDKVKLEKWYTLGYPAEWVQNLVSVQPYVQDDMIAPELEVNMTTANGQLYVHDMVTEQTVTVSVYATDSKSGIASLTFSLDQGSTWTDYETTFVLEEYGIHQLWVKAIDGAGNVALQQYTIKIAQTGSADLNAIAINGKSVTGFAADVTDYTVHVGNSVSEIIVQTEALYAGVQIQVIVNDEAMSFVSEEGATTPLAIWSGNNEVRIRVTSADGLLERTYTVHVIKAAPQADDDYRGPNKSDLVDLSELLLSDGLLQPGFSPKHRQYKVDVGGKLQSITVTAATYHSDVTMTVNGVNLESGATSDPIQLQKGKTDIDIVITARNGLTRTYSVHVFRKNK